MTFSLASDLDFWKTVPAYKPLLKTILKSQIQHLVNQLSEHGGEESVFLTACISDGTLSHIGSKYGQVFLDTRQEFKSQFLQFCCGTDQKTNIQLSAHRTAKKVGIKEKKVKKVKLAANVRCPEPNRAKTEYNSSENVTKNAATINAGSESLNMHTDVSSESTQRLVIKTITNSENEEVYSADTYIEGSARDSDGTKDSETEIDDCKKHVLEDDIVVKVEPNWDSGNEDDNTDDATTMNDTNITEDTDMVDDKTTMEYTSILEESRNMSLTDVVQDGSLAGPSTSLGKMDVQFPYEIVDFNSEDFLPIVKNPRPKAKRKSQSMSTKYNAIVEAEAGLKSKTQIAKDFNVSTSTVSMWFKNAEQIKNEYLCNRIAPDRKRVRRSQFSDVEHGLLQWLRLTEGRNLKITSIHISKKANQLARYLGYSPETFSCNTGWIDRFKLRYGLMKRSKRFKSSASKYSTGLSTYPVDSVVSGDRSTTGPVDGVVVGDRSTTGPVDGVVVGDRSTTGPVVGDRSTTGPVDGVVIGHRSITGLVDGVVIGDGSTTGPVDGVVSNMPSTCLIDSVDFSDGTLHRSAEAVLSEMIASIKAEELCQLK